MSEKFFDLAAIRMAQERHTEAVELLRQALLEKESATGDDAPDLAHELEYLARALWRAGDQPAAEEAMDRAAGLSGQYGGRWLFYREQWEKAAGALREEAATGDDPMLWEELAEAEEKLGRREAAREAWGQAESAWRRSVADGHPRIATCRRRAEQTQAAV